MRYAWWSYIKNIIQQYYAGDGVPFEIMAVQKAIEATEKLPNGQARLKVIDLVLWKRTHTLEGASLQIPCCERTARYWQSDFIKLVAKNFKCDSLIS